MTSATSLVLDHLSVRAGERELLRDVSLTIPAGELTVVIGGSGAGKSVLLRLIAGLVPAAESGIAVTGEIRLSDASPGGPHRVGIVFQNFALFDEWNARDNVQFAIDHRRNRASPPTRGADEWLAELRVDPLAKPSMMSGGQKQRLAIARTLAAEPNIVLYDEPTSGLDRATGLEVASLIARTHAAHDQTSVVVTHDHETLLAIADRCVLLDSATSTLREILKSEWSRIADQLRPVQLRRNEKLAKNSFTETLANVIDRGVLALGGAAISVWEILRLPSDIARSSFSLRWATRFFAHAMRLICGPSSWGYLAMAGAIIGFTSTYFTFRFLPFKLYTKPLLIEDLLGSIGFALYRILVPVLATILIAARCGAAIAADVGVKRYGSQVDALQTLGVRPPAYLLAPTILAFLIATPLLQAIAFAVARVVSLICFIATHPEFGPYFWQQHFYRNLDGGLVWHFEGAGWVLAKSLICGFGIAVVSYHSGISPKESAGQVSEAITATVLWSTLYVLIVHFVIALLEF